MNEEKESCGICLGSGAVWDGKKMLACTCSEGLMWKIAQRYPDRVKSVNPSDYPINEENGDDIYEEGDY